MHINIYNALLVKRLIFYTLQPCIAVCVTTIVIIVLPAELISIKNLCYSMTEVPHT